MAYEAPTITTIGSISDFTQGSDDTNLGDGAAFRGPVEGPPSYGS